MKPNDTPRRSHVHARHLPHRMTASPGLLCAETPEGQTSTQDEGIQHIERSLKEGKTFRQMQLEWRKKQKR